jgi:hypothetical protein
MNSSSVSQVVRMWQNEQGEAHSRFKARDRHALESGCLDICMNDKPSQASLLAGIRNMPWLPRLSWLSNTILNRLLILFNMVT